MSYENILEARTKNQKIIGLQGVILNKLKFLLGFIIIGTSTQLTAMEPANPTKIERTHILSIRKYSQYHMGAPQVVENTFRSYDLAEFVDTTNIIRYLCRRKFGGNIKTACELALFEYKYILMERGKTYELDPEIQKELQRVRTNLNYLISYK